MENASWQLFQVHGSTVWLHNAEVGSTLTLPDHGFDREEEYVQTVYFAALNSVSQLSWTGTYQTAQEIGNGIGDHAEDTVLWVPAIAVPTQTKKGFECPQEHIDRLADFIPEVTHLLSIGWRGAEQHFLSMWQGANAPMNLHHIQIVSGSEVDAQEVKNNLLGVGLACEDTRLATSGFSAFLQNGLLEDFLDPEA